LEAPISLMGSLIVANLYTQLLAKRWEQIRRQKTELQIFTLFEQSDGRQDDHRPSDNLGCYILVLQTAELALNLS
jgi:hypothetical protein